MTGIGAALLGLAVLGAAALASVSAHAAPPAGSAVALVAARCAATVEGAARGIVAGAVEPDAANGFRVHDMVVDLVLRKAYVRVADCHDSRRPLLLVPLDATLAAPTPPGPAVAEHHGAPPADERIAGAAVSSAPPTPTALALIARGDAVEVVLQSSNVHMLLHGSADGAAAAGAPIDVTLASEPGSPARHLRGVAVSAHRVEVQR